MLARARVIGVLAVSAVVIAGCSTGPSTVGSTTPTSATPTQDATTTTSAAVPETSTRHIDMRNRTTLAITTTTVGTTTTQASDPIAWAAQQIATSYHMRSPDSIGQTLAIPADEVASFSFDTVHWTDGMDVDEITELVIDAILESGWLDRADYFDADSPLGDQIVYGRLSELSFEKGADGTKSELSEADRRRIARPNAEAATGHLKMTYFTGNLPFIDRDIAARAPWVSWVEPGDAIVTFHVSAPPEVTLHQDGIVEWWASVSPEGYVKYVHLPELGNPPISDRWPSG